MNGSPIPTPWELYAVAPYQYPLVDLQPVVRIPVVGPEPFNTLVVVRGRIFTTRYAYADGKLTRWSAAVGTNFSLIGFDPRVPPPFQHSTTAALQMIQSSDDTMFVTAVDEVSGRFDDRGVWTITANLGDLWDNVIASAYATISSWVLCYEPPPPDAPRRPWRLEALLPPPRQWTLARAEAPRSEAGIEFERLLRRSQRRRAPRHGSSTGDADAGGRPCSAKTPMTLSDPCGADLPTVTTPKSAESQ